MSADIMSPTRSAAGGTKRVFRMKTGVFLHPRIGQVKPIDHLRDLLLEGNDPKTQPIEPWAAGRRCVADLRRYDQLPANPGLPPSDPYPLVYADDLRQHLCQPSIPGLLSEMGEAADDNGTRVILKEAQLQAEQNSGRIIDEHRSLPHPLFLHRGSVNSPGFDHDGEIVRERDLEIAGVSSVSNAENPWWSLVSDEESHGGVPGPTGIRGLTCAA